jgi:hypothetical protein
VDREQLLNRIQNLLNKTVVNGATEAEAEAAMMAAQRLMDGHNIALAEVLSYDETAVSFGNETIWEGKSVSGLQDAALTIVGEVFAVRTIVLKLGFNPAEFGLKGQGFRRKTFGVKMILVGDPTNIDSAKWALRFLVGTFKHLWDAYRLRTGDGDRWTRQGYISGLKRGFLDKLREERAERKGVQAGSANSLVPLSSRLDQAFEAFVADYEKADAPSRLVNAAAYESGCRDGREINLARPIGKAKPKRLKGKSD